jgi:peptidoglycan/LPS O-acetylase OafA/YrhL
MTSEAKGHYVTLDGLRGVCAIAVLLFHRRWWAPGGHFIDHAYLAVDFFFALSGFVLAHAYQQRLLNGMGVVEFMKIRAIRLYPLLILGGVIGAAFLTGRYVSKSESFHMTFWIAIFCGALALPTPLPIPFGYGPFPINGPAWSLFFEMAVNFLYAAFAKQLRSTALLVVIFVSFIWLAICAKHGGGLGKLGHSYELLIDGIPRTLFAFFAGTYIYSIHERFRFLRLPFPTFFLGATLICVFTPNSNSVNSTFYDLFCVAFIFPGVLLIGANSGGNENNPVASALGELSYPVYILHYPMFNWLEALANRMHLSLDLTALVIFAMIVVALSAILLKLYDQPARKYLWSYLKAEPLFQGKGAKTFPVAVASRRTQPILMEMSSAAVEALERSDS